MNRLISLCLPLALLTSCLSQSIQSSSGGIPMAPADQLYAAEPIYGAVLRHLLEGEDPRTTVRVAVDSLDRASIEDAADPLGIRPWTERL